MSAPTVLIPTLDAALDAIRDGETDWEILTKNLGRNDWPEVLTEVTWAMPDGVLAEAVMQVWVSAEFPENLLDRELWLDMFDEIGYRHNTDRLRPPSEVQLWRGGAMSDRMAWTADRDLAEWFCRRFPGGKLWTATARGDQLLAYYDAVRTGESEYIVNPLDLHPRLVESEVVTR